MRKLVRILILLLAASCTSQEAVPTDVLPDIWPDYAGVTIPRSIAPLNFEVRGADAVQAVLSNGSREVRVRGSFVGIPLRKWRSLTAAGDSLTVQVKARIDGQWRAYLPLSIHLSDDPVDLSLVYRRVDPGYETYARMGIYQRDLASFREKALFENTRIDPGCVNCHSFAHCDPASMQLHFRGGKGGTQVHVSRIHPGLVKRLFEMEVPEIQKGEVQIKSIAREAGSRTKIAVHSTDAMIDPVGSCVGPRGQRVDRVVTELKNEKIDIIKWSQDPTEFVSNALNPANVLSATINEKEKICNVVVPDNQLSLAIGKEGQNARLAARLTGWKIDIKSATQAAEAEQEKEAPAAAEAKEPEMPDTSDTIDDLSIDELDLDDLKVDDLDIPDDVK